MIKELNKKKALPDYTPAVTVLGEGLSAVFNTAPFNPIFQAFPTNTPDCQSFYARNFSSVMDVLVKNAIAAACPRF